MSVKSRNIILKTRNLFNTFFSIFLVGSIVIIAGCENKNTYNNPIKEESRPQSINPNPTPPPKKIYPPFCIFDISASYMRNVHGIYVDKGGNNVKNLIGFHSVIIPNDKALSGSTIKKILNKINEDGRVKLEGVSKITQASLAPLKNQNSDRICFLPCVKLSFFPNKGEMKESLSPAIAYLLLADIILWESFRQHGEEARTIDITKSHLFKKTYIKCNKGLYLEIQKGNIINIHSKKPNNVTSNNTADFDMFYQEPYY